MVWCDRLKNVTTILYNSSHQKKSLFPQPLTPGYDQSHGRRGGVEVPKPRPQKAMLFPPLPSWTALPPHREARTRLLNVKRLHAEEGPVTATIKVPAEIPDDYSCMSDSGENGTKTTQLNLAKISNPQTHEKE